MKLENVALLAFGIFAAAKLFGKSAEDLEHEAVIKDLKTKPIPPPPGQTAPPVPKLSKAEARAIAQRQFLAMNRPGTDEDELFRSLNGLNGADLRQVFEQFGRRNYYTGRRPLDLFGWYVEELDPAELSAMRIYWYKSGVTF